MTRHGIAVIAAAGMLSTREGPGPWFGRYGIHLSSFHLAPPLCYNVKGRNFISGEHCSEVPKRGFSFSSTVVLVICCIPVFYPSSLRKALLAFFSFRMLLPGKASVICQEAQQTLLALSGQATFAPLGNALLPSASAGLHHVPTRFSKNSNVHLDEGSV